jgi:hypothetical protein
VLGGGVGAGVSVGDGVHVRVGVSIHVRVRVGVLVGVDVPGGRVLVIPLPEATGGKRTPTIGTGGRPGLGAPMAVMQRTAITAASTAMPRPQRLMRQSCASGALRSSSISPTIAWTSASVTSLPFSFVASVASPYTPERE